MKKLLLITALATSLLACKKEVSIIQPLESIPPPPTIGAVNTDPNAVLEATEVTEEQFNKDFPAHIEGMQDVITVRVDTVDMTQHFFNKCTQDTMYLSGYRVDFGRQRIVHDTIIAHYGFKYTNVVAVTSTGKPYTVTGYLEVRYKQVCTGLQTGYPTGDCWFEYNHVSNKVTFTLGSSTLLSLWYLRQRQNPDGTNSFYQERYLESVCK